MQTVVQIKVNPPSGTLILDRPDKRNALTRLMMLQIKEGLEDLRMERSVRAVILTGAGTAFCAGMDLDEMHLTAGELDAEKQWYEDAVQYRGLLEQLLRYPKPIIAAVNGPAVAGGAGMVLAADLAIASETAKFGLPEPRRGIAAGLVAPLLHFRCGGRVAARLLLVADLLSATSAHELGLYTEVMKTDVVWARAHALAEECAQSAPESLQLTKRLLNETIGETLFTQLSVGAAASATARTTEAAREGLAAFLQKRQPQWP